MGTSFCTTGVIVTPGGGGGGGVVLSPHPAHTISTPVTAVSIQECCRARGRTIRVAGDSMLGPFFSETYLVIASASVSRVAWPQFPRLIVTHSFVQVFVGGYRRTKLLRGQRLPHLGALCPPSIRGFRGPILHELNDIPNIAPTFVATTRNIPVHRRRRCTITCCFLGCPGARVSTANTQL